MKTTRKRSVLVQNAAGARRDDVNDAVSAFFELAEQGRQHLSGLNLGVMKQHDAVVDLLDPAKDQAQFFVCGHGVPVASPDVGAKYDDAAVGQAVEQRLGRGKARKPEERRAASTFLPNRKNVARTHSALSASSTLGVVPGHGPSSNVSTNSLRRSGNVVGKCLRPTRGVVLASTSMTRSVPRAWLLPGHGAASAAKGAMATASAKVNVRIMMGPWSAQLTATLCARQARLDDSVYALIICRLYERGVQAKSSRKY
jgi:hypothetical protein